MSNDGSFLSAGIRVGDVLTPENCPIFAELTGGMVPTGQTTSAPVRVTKVEPHAITVETVRGKPDA